MSIKPVIEQFSVNKPRKLCKFTIKHSKIGNITLNTKSYQNNQDMYITHILDKNNSQLGFELFDIKTKPEKQMFGYKIEIEPKYRGEKLSELLRLSSIIEMIENGIETLKIYSKNTAIFFHSKYGFVPAIKQFDQRNYALQKIADCNLDGFQSFKYQADKMLNEIKNIPIQKGEYHREMCKKANHLINDFINKAKETNNTKNINFDIGFDMILDKKNILENKEFYNKLFKKHNIDYRITQ